MKKEKEGKRNRERVREGIREREREREREFAINFENLKCSILLLPRVF